MRNQGRNVNIDALRGLAAVLVVLGHAIQLSSPNFDDNILFRMIYSFHMPLFMFISGVVVYKPERELNMKLLMCRTQSLLIPFLSYTVIIYFTRGIYKTDNFLMWLGRCIKQPDLSLWFLWILFLNYLALCVTAQFTKYFGDIAFVTVILICVMLYVAGIPIDYGGNLCIWHIPFFFGGYLLSKYKEKIAGAHRIILSICGVCFLPLSALWRRTGESEIRLYIRQWGANKLTENCVWGGMNYLTAILGIGFCGLLVWYLMSDRAKEVLGYIGKKSLSIYYFNVAAISVIHINHFFVNVYVATYAGVVIPIAIAYFLKKVKIINYLVLGTGNE